MEAIFVGTHDITRRAVAKLRDPEYRKKYEEAYREDLAKYGEELSLDRANKRLHFQRKTRPTLLRLWNLAQSGGLAPKLSQEEMLLVKTVRELPRKPLAKEQLLNLNRYLLVADDVAPDIIVDNPFELGEVAQILYAEKLPTVRLWIHFKEYVIGGVPDGVAGTYVYEFKSTFQKGRRLEAVKEQAIRQALIYRYAFKRPEIKVQIAHFQLSKDAFPIKVKDLPKPEVATVHRPAAENEALGILDGFDRAFADATSRSINHDARPEKRAFSDFRTLPRHSSISLAISPDQYGFP